MSWDDAAGQAQEPAEPPVDPRRPHWMPEEVWLGKVDGEWPLQAFSSQTQAEAWATVQASHRRIWRVEIPADTPIYQVREIPARVELVEVQP